MWFGALPSEWRTGRHLPEDRDRACSVRSAPAATFRQDQQRAASVEHVQRELGELIAAGFNGIDIELPKFDFAKEIKS
ncbi:hypothetical protein V7S43_010037 [Phytophthora oleae]|uniref:Uncharacterized protein n=1 Tax=Phytophthora oleae TaxID=2107226 RepID=A0ABD3FEX9_9STRA